MKLFNFIMNTAKLPSKFIINLLIFKAYAVKLYISFVIVLTSALNVTDVWTAKKRAAYGMSEFTCLHLNVQAFFYQKVLITAEVV